MAMLAYMKVKGQKQGNIQGSVTQKRREGSIEVIEFHHSILSPRDAVSGLPTGKRMHKPLTITKPTDKATTHLYAALTANENLPEVTIDFWTPQIKAATGAGTEVQFYTVKLTNASISSIAAALPNRDDPSQQKLPLHEVVEFTYQKIEWTWKEGGATAMDDWAVHT